MFFLTESRERVKARQERRGEVRLLSRREEMPVRDPALWEKSRSFLWETKWNRVFDAFAALL